MPRHAHPDLAVLCAELAQIAVARTFRVPLAGLCAPSRDRAEVAFARQVAMYLTHTFFGISLTRTGAAFGRDRTTVTHACRVIEEALEDYAVECAVEHAAALLRIERCADAKARRRTRKTITKTLGERHAETIGA